MKSKWLTALAIFAFVMATVYTLLGMLWQPAKLEIVVIPRYVPIEMVKVMVQPPEIITVYQPAEIITKKVTVNQTIEVPIEKIVYRDIYTREWESVEQFKDWYYSQNFTLLMPSGAYMVECDDYATRVQDRALRQGYKVSEALAWQHYYGGVYVTEKIGLHDGCMVLIGNYYYWVEPQVDEFKMVEVCKRD